MADLADSKNQRVVFDADSNALISFSIFYFLRVLFPPGSWRTFLVNKSMYAGPTGLKFSATGQLSKENHVTIKFFQKSKILHFLGVKSEFYLLLTAFWTIVSKPLWNNPKIYFRGYPDLSQNGSLNEIFGFYT